VVALANSALAAGVDEAPEEVPRLLRPETQAEAEPGPEAERVPEPRVAPDREPRPWRPAPAPPRPLLTPKPRPRPRPAEYTFGVRAGLVTSSRAERDWGNSGSIGVFVRRVPGSPDWMAVEFGADRASPETADGVVSSVLYTLRAEFLFDLFVADGVAAYALAGGQAIRGEGRRNATGEESSERGGGAEVGFGVSLSGGWDVRGVYSILFASENTERNFAFSVGYIF
jgi:hypothetical protein